MISSDIVHKPLGFWDSVERGRKLEGKVPSRRCEGKEKPNSRDLGSWEAVKSGQRLLVLCGLSCVSLFCSSRRSTVLLSEFQGCLCRWWRRRRLGLSQEIIQFFPEQMSDQIKAFIH